MNVIVNRNGEFWSNKYGWTSYTEADLFTDEERESMNLPVGGEWRKSLGGPDVSR